MPQQFARETTNGKCGARPQGMAFEFVDMDLEQGGRQSQKNKAAAGTGWGPVVRAHRVGTSTLLCDPCPAAA